MSINATTFGTPLRCSQNIGGAHTTAMNTARKKGTMRELAAFIPATTMTKPARIDYGDFGLDCSFHTITHSNLLSSLPWMSRRPIAAPRNVTTHLRARQEINGPSGSSFCPLASLRKGHVLPVHLAFSRLRIGQKILRHLTHLFPSEP